MSGPGRPIGHSPANKGHTLPGTKKPATTTLRPVRDLVTIIDASGLPGQIIQDRAGVHLVTISRWKHGKSAPNLADFVAVAEALGYDVRLIPIDRKQQVPTR